MKIRPLGEKILVKRVEAETQTKSGIYLPETAKEKPQQAKVVAVGDGKLLDEVFSPIAHRPNRATAAPEADEPAEVIDKLRRLGTAGHGHGNGHGNGQGAGTPAGLSEPSQGGSAPN